MLTNELLSFDAGTVEKATAKEAVKTRINKIIMDKRTI
jgi:hypothetical protein